MGRNKTIFICKIEDSLSNTILWELLDMIIFCAILGKRSFTNAGLGNQLKEAEENGDLKKQPCHLNFKPEGLSAHGNTMS